jgi:enoyl-CoA hydratase
MSHPALVPISEVTSFGPEAELLDAELEDGVHLLTLNRPKRRNALSAVLVDVLEARIGELAADPRAKAVVITGQGPHFCAGGDFGGQAPDGVLAGHDARGRFAGLLRQIVSAGMPCVAAVNGDAMGGGCGLALACHMVVASESSSFATPELKLGLFPWMIYPILSRNLPPKILHEMILTDRRLEAREAVVWGAINRVVPAEEVVPQAVSLARTCASRSPAVVSLGLKGTAACADMGLEPALQYLQTLLSLNLMTEDAAEGIAAFFGRRPPVWTGR